MAFDDRVNVNPQQIESNNPLYRDYNTRDAGGQLPEIVKQNPQMPLARRNRQLIRWRVPGAGFVDMYINPQNLSINEKKVVRSTRTKGGYVVQYWGEELSRISISGTTGGSSIEGINILRKVYRAEQEAFQQVEQTLIDRLQEYTASVGLGALIAGQATNVNTGSAVPTLVNTIVGGAQAPPLLPTLASLAASVELYYQGWVFKGYFEDFKVDETASNPGIFDYTMNFIVLDRRGERKNFTEWARTPATYDPASGKPIGYFKANSSSTPLSYRGED